MLEAGQVVRLRTGELGYIVKTDFAKYKVDMLKFNPDNPNFPSKDIIPVHLENIEGIMMALTSRCDAGITKPTFPDELKPRQMVKLYGAKGRHRVIQRRNHSFYIVANTAGKERQIHISDVLAITSECRA